MTQRVIPALVAIALLAGCGANSLPSAGQRTATQATVASATAAVTAFGTRAVADFDKKPSLGLVKKPAPIRIDPVTDPSRDDVPETIAKIQGLATTGLAEAEKKETWNDRWSCTDGALVKIDGVKLVTNGCNNVPTKVGLNAARGYGYLGMHPTHENRFKIQAVTLNFLRANDAEASLAKGSPIFTMSADMLEASTGWDQGFRIGLSVLLTLKENYKDREVSKAVQAVIDKSLAAATKEESYEVMVNGLRDLSKKYAR